MFNNINWLKRYQVAWLFVVGLFLLYGQSLLAETLTPDETVSAFYNAIKDGKYEQAYDYTSQKMKDGKDRKQWAGDWKKTVEMSQAEIFNFTVSPAKITDFTDGEKATVRTEINSKDIINKDGIVETETDYLVKENGIWKIDATEVDLPDY